ncbi:hypothetical protein [uncultured Pseudokineococcus sp.]|uniref:hypothetical protein n=1 Tax=uncultured Pseudokineococcus sp. TaxID=1642928 RepID=UPI00262D7A4B|nr:hypothetical protein [uncultured Pseudokineococcus sp.]
MSRARSVPLPKDKPACPLDLADTAHREWDIVMIRDQRWVRVSTGITDADEVRRQLDWYRLGNRSVTFHVIERTTTLREVLVDEDALLRP